MSTCSTTHAITSLHKRLPGRSEKAGMPGCAMGGNARAKGIEVERNVNEGIGAVAGRAGHGKDPPKAVFHVRRVAWRGRVEGEGL